MMRAALFGRLLAAMSLAGALCSAAAAQEPQGTEPAGGAPAAAPPASEAPIEVSVDPRVELLSLVFRLAGNPEYNQRSSASPYAEEVEAHFGPFRDHPAVATARRLRREHGVSFDAVMSMAVHVEDAAGLAERIPFDEEPERLDRRWGVAEARAFLDELREFVAVSGFGRFVADHEGFYRAAAERLRAQVQKRPYVAWFDGFFGGRPAAEFRVIPGLLNGGGNYGVGVRFPDGREEITPIIGIGRFDDEGLPVVGDGIAGTIVHELCHSYTNPLVDRAAAGLEAPGRALYGPVAAVMQRQAYGTWRTMMYESLVRACTVRFMAASEGPEAAGAEVRRHEGRGFAWTGALSELLARYEAQRDRYPTFDGFMPEVVAFFVEYARGAAGPPP